MKRLLIALAVITLLLVVTAPVLASQNPLVGTRSHVRH